MRLARTAKRIGNEMPFAWTMSLEQDFYFGEDATSSGK